MQRVHSTECVLETTQVKTEFSEGKKLKLYKWIFRLVCKVESQTFHFHNTFTNFH